MGIAAITIFCNESFRIGKWLEYYQDYKDELTLHIIVDNASDAAESQQVKQAFPASQYIKLSENGGVTAAYNAGIRQVFDDELIDAIAFIGNDIKLERGGLSRLYSFLMSDERLGEVSPILFKKDSLVIEDNGDWFPLNLTMEEYDAGKTYNSEIKEHLSDGLPGAANLAKKQMYADIGLLDETLFMYSDEVDIGIRAKKAGFLFSSCTSAKAWHQHENVHSKTHREPFSEYLTIRNKVYLAKKHYGLVRLGYVFFSLLFISIRTIGSGIIRGDSESRTRGVWRLRGAIYGLFGNMKPNRFSQPGGANEHH